MKLFKGERVGYLFIIPGLLYMACLMFYPIIYNFILSFQKVDVMSLMKPDKEFIFFDNYINVFEKGAIFNSINKSFIFTIGCIVFQFSLGLLLAVLFNRQLKIYKFMKAVIMVPYIMPVTVTAILWKFMFSVKGGIINEALMMLGIIKQPVEWLLMPDSAMWSVIIGNIWCGVPFNMILLASGLVSIPAEMYESALIDGANAIQKFIYITIPLLKASIKAVLVLGFVYTFRCFELVYVMTAGGPVDGTEIIPILSYKRSFVQFNFSEGAAIGNIMFIILFTVGLLYTRMISKEEVM